VRYYFAIFVSVCSSRERERARKSERDLRQRRPRCCVICLAIFVSMCSPRERARARERERFETEKAEVLCDMSCHLCIYVFA